ncbi:MAG: DUF2892 domain-containing protein, partial [SAR324 cluster bacterium]|nr:DUF2892 domain-containing protein [SAR324 cluster bacterium]
MIYNNWWGLVGLIPLVTGTMSWCPIYNLVGLSSLDEVPKGRSCRWGSTKPASIGNVIPNISTSNPSTVTM